MRFPSLDALVAPLILTSLALSACAGPETRLASGLREAGMGQKSSQCIAHEMADDLSLGQLLKLSKLGKFRESSLGQLSISEFLKATRALQDPEILKIASAATVVCAIKS